MIRRPFNPPDARVARAKLLLAGAWLMLLTGTLGAQDKRPMNFLDVQLMRNAQGLDLSNDGKWALYALSVPNWKEAKRYTDIFLVSTDEGLPSTRQLTFTKDKNEVGPQWLRR